MLTAKALWRLPLAQGETRPSTSRAATGDRQQTPTGRPPPSRTAQSTLRHCRRHRHLHFSLFRFFLLQPLLPAARCDSTYIQTHLIHTARLGETVAALHDDKPSTDKPWCKPPCYSKSLVVAPASSVAHHQKKQPANLYETLLELNIASLLKGQFFFSFFFPLPPGYLYPSGWVSRVLPHVMSIPDAGTTPSKSSSHHIHNYISCQLPPPFPAPATPCAHVRVRVCVFPLVPSSCRTAICLFTASLAVMPLPFFFFFLGVPMHPIIGRHAQVLTILQREQKQRKKNNKSSYIRRDSNLHLFFTHGE